MADYDNKIVPSPKFMTSWSLNIKDIIGQTIRTILKYFFQDPKNVQELTNYIQQMLQQMQDRFQSMSDQVICTSTKGSLKALCKYYALFKSLKEGRCFVQIRLKTCNLTFTRVAPLISTLAYVATQLRKVF